MRSVLSHFRAVAGIPLMAAACIVASGCATTTDQREPALPTIDTASRWRDALLQGDIAAAVNLIAVEFSSAQWAARGQLAEYLTVAKARGYFDNAVAISGANPAEIAIRSAMGTAVWTLTVRENAEVPQITSARLEIY